MIDKHKSDTSNNGVKKFTQFISRSSQRFLSSFIDDEAYQEKQIKQIFQKINQAMAQKSMVVIQYKDTLQDKSSDGFETLVGRIYQHSNNPESLVIKLQKNNQVKMISAKNIKKISIISPSYNRHLSASK
ncbi:MAG: hypothetical protein ACTJHC_04465 [Vagococcus sp.]